jgi:hypothetical protein
MAGLQNSLHHSQIHFCSIPRNLIQVTTDFAFGGGAIAVLKYGALNLP